MALRSCGLKLDCSKRGAFSGSTLAPDEGKREKSPSPRLEERKGVLPARGWDGESKDSGAGAESVGAGGDRSLPKEAVGSKAPAAADGYEAVDSAGTAEKEWRCCWWWCRS